MLTIQPNVSIKKINFGNDMDDALNRSFYCEDCDEFTFEKPESEYCSTLKDDIRETIDNLRDVKEIIPNEKGKKVLNGFMTLGAAALSGVSVKFGYDQTSKVLGNLFTKPGMKKLIGNLKKPFVAVFEFTKKYVNDLFEKFKKTNIFNHLSEKFGKLKNSDCGKKFLEKFTSFKESKFGKKISKIYENIKGIKSTNVNNIVGNTLGVATGVSTVVVKNLEKKSNDEEIMVA